MTKIFKRTPETERLKRIYKVKKHQSILHRGSHQLRSDYKKSKRIYLDYCEKEKNAPLLMHVEHNVHVSISKKTIVHQFWYSLNQSNRLRALNMYSILSILNQGHKMVLWSYQPFENVPHDNALFELRDCNELLLFAEFKQYLDNGIHIAHISDYIRILALKNYGGWWLDSDSIVLKPLPTEDPYYFATLPTKRAGGGFFHYERKPATWLGAKYFAGLDGKDEFCNAPFYVEKKNDPWAIKIAAYVRKKLAKGRPMLWRTILNKMQATIVDRKWHDYVHPPIAFCPVPFWMRDNPIKESFDAPQSKWGAIIPTAADILANSVCVQFFFMSSEKDKTAERNDEWLQGVREKYPCSLLNQVLACVTRDYLLGRPPAE